MKLTTVTVFAAGYIVGARAGRAQITDFVQGASQQLKKQATQRLEEFIARHPPRAVRATSGEIVPQAPRELTGGR